MRTSFFVMSWVFVFCHSFACTAQTVGGNGGTVAPPSMVSPELPTTNDVIEFTLIADGMTHSNSCFQLIAFGGNRFSVVVDNENRTIQISVTGTPAEICTLEFSPVNGLRGSVGPLAAGDWEIVSSIGSGLNAGGLLEPVERILFTVAEPSSAGDFDSDGAVDVDDIDSYAGNLGMPANGDLAQLDLNGDDLVTLADHDLLITTLVETINGQTGAIIGDLNLDGSVDVLEDAFAFVCGLGSSHGGYAKGDLNADQVTDVLGDAFRFVANLGRTNAPD